MTDLTVYKRKFDPDSDSLRGLKKMSFFLAFIALVVIFLHLSIGAGLRRISTSTFGVWNQIVSGQIDADVLISGSSRAMSHYDPRQISATLGLNAYNIGLNGSQTDMQLARLKVYLEYNKRPLLLIHNLDIFSLQVSHAYVYDPAQYMPYLEEGAIYAALRKIYPPVWKSRYIPLYGYTVEDLRFTWVVGLRALSGWNPVEDHFLGYRPKDTPWTEDFEKLRATNPNGVTFNIEPDGVKAMEDMLKLCRDRGIKVLMVYSPEYSAMQKLTKDRAAAFRVFENLANKYGAELWDYSSSDISEDRDNFYNSQHLNQHGAARFSQQLGRRLASDPAYRELAIAPDPNLKAQPTRASSP